MAVGKENYRLFVPERQSPLMQGVENGKLGNQMLLNPSETESNSLFKAAHLKRFWLPKVITALQILLLKHPYSPRHLSQH